MNKPIEVQPPPTLEPQPLARELDVSHAIQALDRNPTPLDLLQRAVQNNAQVDVLEKLMGLQERWEANAARRGFDAAISKAKAEIPVINKGNLVDFTSRNGRTNYRYEDLATIARVVDPILSKFGLSYRFRTQSDSKAVTITCILSHSAGHSEENTLYAPHDLTGNKNPIQAVGSTVTYLQRYTLKAALGLAAAADDDARGGVDNPPPPESKPSPTTFQQRTTPPEHATFPVVNVLSVKEVHSKPESKTKWTAWFCTFDDGAGQFEAGTFDKKVADLASELNGTGENARLVTEPGKKPGSRSIVSLTRAEQPPTPEEDQVPMEFPETVP